MIKALQECLNNKQGSYILPFFWQHGEEIEVYGYREKKTNLKYVN